MIQRSPEWMQCRMGKVTASRVADIMRKGKSGPSASRKNYMAELVCERLTGAKAEGFESPAMAWGTENEPFARAEYEARNICIVEEVGFVVHPTIPMAGASPDGLVGDDGLIEIKCPNTATHIETLITGKVDPDYLYQMAWQMECTGRTWCDFVSYDPRLPPNLCYWETRVLASQFDMVEIRAEVCAFLAELDAMEAKLRGLAA